jgi:hypothetical protein
MILFKPWLKVSIRQQCNQTTPVVGTDYSTRMGLWITLRHKKIRRSWKKFLGNFDLGTHQSKHGLRWNSDIIARVTYNTTV